METISWHLICVSFGAAEYSWAALVGMSVWQRPKEVGRWGDTRKARAGPGGWEHSSTGLPADQLRSLAVTLTAYVLTVWGGRNWAGKREVPHGFVAQPLVS